MGAAMLVKIKMRKYLRQHSTWRNLRWRFLGWRYTKWPKFTWRNSIIKSLYIPTELHCKIYQHVTKSLKRNIVHTLYTNPIKYDVTKSRPNINPIKLDYSAGTYSAAYLAS